MPRPTRLVVVTGTGTEVGKTWVAARLLEHFASRGLAVAARKPVQSYAEGDPRTDADVLAEASGEDPFAVCPADRRYPVAMAPPMAAAVLGRPALKMAELTIEWPPHPTDLGLVEGAGGVASPLADNGDTADLARQLAADAALVVSDPGLGVIHHVRLAVAHLAPLPTVVYLNRFVPGSDLHRRNAAWLSSRDGLTVCTDIEALGAALLPS